VLTLAALGLAAAIAAPAAAQPITRCAACHIANLAHVPGGEHVGEWQRSAHARQGVGCHECHGGNQWAIEAGEAHRGVLGPAHPLSPVNRLNVATTCARCHRRNALAYGTTLHATLVDIEDRRAPVCTTCHGIMSARVPSPATLEARCASCHPPGSPRASYPGRMRDALEGLTVEQTRAAALQDQVERMTDYSTRVALLGSLLDAREQLKTAVEAIHRLDPLAVVQETAAVKRRLDRVAASAR